MNSFRPTPTVSLSVPIEGVGLLKIEPWQLPVRDEQAVLDEPAHDAGDDAIQDPIPDWRESFASVR